MVETLNFVIKYWYVYLMFVSVLLYIDYKLDKGDNGDEQRDLNK